jgi:uncharacterized protein DUF6493
MTLVEDVRRAADAGDEAAIRGLIAPLSEDERGELAPFAREIAKIQVARGVDAVRDLGPMLLLAYGTLPVTEIRKLGWRSNHLPPDVAEVLRRRAPERLGPIVTYLLEEVGGARAWTVVRRLVRDGVVPRPDGDAYIIGMLTASAWRPASELLAEDPGLLEIEVWRLFEVEGGGEDSLANYEKFHGDGWGEAFRSMAARDPGARARLLDASLAALARDFSTYRAGWFSRFHESLQPTDEERAERVASYLGLVRSRVGPTVSFAVAALGVVARAGRLPPAQLLDSIGPALVDGSAGTAKSALDLIARAGAGATPDAASRAAMVAAAGLEHPSADVQRAAIAVVGKLAPGRNEAVASAVGARLADVAASQRSAALALAERLGAAAPTGGVVAVPTRVAAPRRVTSPTDASRAIEHLATLEALVDIAVSILETAEPADDIERVLDGVRRHADRGVGGFARLTAPIAKRARTLLARRESRPFNGFDPRSDVAGVLLAWSAGELIPAAPGYGQITPGAGAFLSARAREAAEDVAHGRARTSVALPTHRGGWIEPAALVDRLAAGPPTSSLDLVAAVLRLAAEGRAAALEAAARLDSEVGAVVRYALGGNESVGPTAAWWVAAARVRSPGMDDDAVDRKHPRLGPEAALAASATLKLVRPKGTYERLELIVQPQPVDVVPIDMPTAHMLRNQSAFAWTGRSDPGMFRWIATVQPGYRETWAAVGSLLIGTNLDWWSAEWGNRAFLEPFLDPWTPLGPQALLLLGIALGAKEAGERGLAADVARLAITDGRLDGAGLAKGLSGAAAVALDRPQRWAISLADVAAESAGHAGLVAEAIGQTLPVVQDRAPGSLVPLLRALDELLAEIGSAPTADARPTLDALATRGTQTGRLTRSILEKGPPPEGLTR